MDLTARNKTPFAGPAHGRRKTPHARIVVTVVTLGIIAIGCNRQEPIRHYTVPNPAELYAQNHVEGAADAANLAPDPSAAPTDRLIGAVVPRGAQTWYFKMVGPTAAVAAQESAFRQLIESITFASDDKPRWQLPEGWSEKPGVGQRMATLIAGGDAPSLEVSIIPLPTIESATSLQDNVNRWRRQMGLGPAAAGQLALHTKSVTLSAGNATLVTIDGRFQRRM